MSYLSAYFWPAKTANSEQELGAACAQQCVDNLNDCIRECKEDAFCIYQCELDEAVCINYCPCFPGCPLGCENCDSPSCNCREGEDGVDFIVCKVKGFEVELNDTVPFLEIDISNFLRN